MDINIYTFTHYNTICQYGVTLYTFQDYINIDSKKIYTQWETKDLSHNITIHGLRYCWPLQAFLEFQPLVEFWLKEHSVNIHGQYCKVVFFFGSKGVETWSLFIWEYPTDKEDQPKISTNLKAPSTPSIFHEATDKKPVTLTNRKMRQ